MSGTVAEKALSSVFPTGEIAWSGMSGGVQKEISDGLAISVNDGRENGIAIKTDFFPSTTTYFEEWENTFRLPAGNALTDVQRRARLVSSWSKISPASYTGMNQIYQLSGFDVVARPIAPGEDPRIISDVDMIYVNGRPGAAIKNYICKTGVARTGQISDSSRCGAFNGSIIVPPVIVVPDDTWTWPLLYVIEGPGGTIADIPIELKAAFDFLTYKIKPLFMWALSRVNYV